MTFGGSAHILRVVAAGPIEIFPAKAAGLRFPSVLYGAV